MCQSGEARARGASVRGASQHNTTLEPTYSGHCARRRAGRSVAVLWPATPLFAVPHGGESLGQLPPRCPRPLPPINSDPPRRARSSRTYPARDYLKTRDRQRSNKREDARPSSPLLPIASRPAAACAPLGCRGREAGGRPPRGPAARLGRARANRASHVDPYHDRAASTVCGGTSPHNFAPRSRGQSRRSQDAEDARPMAASPRRMASSHASTRARPCARERRSGPKNPRAPSRPTSRLQATSGSTSC